eukprot:gnl/TRDRNA2_/TRDRNA2_38698_c0_seq2.p1 gnl/TRDRNA2_/TRDRNA2_38698_c0~~gnl/TRDRNA2_/TRDRNA2_38698_c0_seq2.p1  ORF type:complete len:410 (+),score=98.95 gnl/TRDRNA2_/TRDRNA2_38698_c0_seq2:32-1261(+)
MPEGSSHPQAIVISGAGTQEANGVYRATAKEYCDAPVYEHVERHADLKITREPHTNPKTGKTKHGWLLGMKKQPLYGVQSESLSVPATDWRKFQGEAPVPTVRVHTDFLDVFFGIADDAKYSGDAAAEREDWQAACDSFSSGVDALKRSGERFGEPFKHRAALLLARRANAQLKLQAHRLALRDAVAALELVRGLASAEMTAVAAARALGAPDDAAAQRILEPVGQGRILDSGAPLVLRCIERWLDAVIKQLTAADQDEQEGPLPVPVHRQSDRYLDGLDEKTRADIIKQYLPDLHRPNGGSATIDSAEQCLKLMKEWEQALSSELFERQKKELWDNRALSYPVRIRETKILIAKVLAPVLEPLGYAPGRPGLSRCVTQMQPHWSSDKSCARKAIDLEEMCDVSLADLQ